MLSENSENGNTWGFVERERASSSGLRLWGDKSRIECGGNGRSSQGTDALWDTGGVCKRDWKTGKETVGIEKRARKYHRKKIGTEFKEFQKASMGDGKGLHTTTITNWVVLNYYKACLQGSVALLCFQRQAPTPTIPIFRLDRLIHHIIFVIACFPVLRVGSLTRSTRYFTSTTGFPLKYLSSICDFSPVCSFFHPIRSLTLFFFLFFASTHDGISPT